MRTAGATIPELLNFMDGRLPGERNAAIDYLNKAFGQRLRLTLALTSFGGEPDPTLLEQAERWIDEKRASWEAESWPELPRVRDYFSFLELSRDERLIVSVCGARDGANAYRLHGVYDADSGETAWSGKRGEHLRAALNRRLGAELVRFGPHDDWEHRNNPEVAGPLWGPQAPTIQFNPDGEITNYLRWQDMAQSWPYQRHWPRLYPHHEVDS
jgi:hypothetical protein